MIRIENSNLKGIADEYYIRLTNWLGTNTAKDKLRSKIKSKKSGYSKMLNFVYEGIRNRDLILCEPGNLEDRINEFKSQFKKELDIYEKSKKQQQTNFGKFKSTMESLYKGFFNSKCKPVSSDTQDSTLLNGHWLAQSLNITTCPYCNRTYTFTISENDVKIRPQFDHFYPKSEFPFLALSFYNLIPVCPTCNLLKGDKKISFNPYQYNFGNEYKFIIKSPDNSNSWLTDKNQITIDFTEIPDKDNNNIGILGLRQLYNGHTDYVSEIIDKAQAYNSSYYDTLINSFQGTGKTREEIDRLIWGKYMETTAHCKRPFSKLTRDILEQLGIK